MATNLVAVIMQFLTPDMIAKIASALGLDRNVAQKAIGGAAPALLSSLADLASTPRWRHASSPIRWRSKNPIRTRASRISSAGSGQKTLAETGSNMLAGLFGGGAMDTMAQTIGKFAGIGEGSGKSIVDAPGPVVLGVLGNSSAGLVSMQPGWRLFSARKESISPRRFRRASPIS